MLASASTAEAEVRNAARRRQGKGGNVAAAKLVGARLAQKAKAAGIETVAFDRAGYPITTAASRRWPKPRAKAA